MSTCTGCVMVIGVTLALSCLCSSALSFRPFVKHWREERLEAGIRAVFNQLVNPNRHSQDLFVQDCPHSASTTGGSLKLYGLSTAFTLRNVSCGYELTGGHKCQGYLTFRWLRLLRQSSYEQAEVMLAPAVKAFTIIHHIGRYHMNVNPWPDLVKMHTVHVYRGSYDKKLGMLVKHCTLWGLDMLNRRIEQILAEMSFL